MVAKCFTLRKVKQREECYLGSAEGQMRCRLAQEKLWRHAPLEAPELAQSIRRQDVNRRPVGRRVERANAQGEELGPGVHLVVRGSPALWNIVGHVKSSVKMVGREKIGLEYEKSTEKSTPGGRKMAEKAGMWKMHRNQEKLGGNKPQEAEIEKTTPK